MCVHIYIYIYIYRLTHNFDAFGHERLCMSCLFDNNVETLKRSPVCHFRLPVSGPVTFREKLSCEVLGCGRRAWRGKRQTRLPACLSRKHPGIRWSQTCTDEQNSEN